MTVREALEILMAAEDRGEYVGALSACEWVGQLVAWGIDPDATYVPTAMRADVSAVTA